MLVVMTAPLLGGIPERSPPAPLRRPKHAFLILHSFLAAITAMSCERHQRMPDLGPFFRRQVIVGFEVRHEIINFDTKGLFGES
jgi:hypothetical protein